MPPIRRTLALLPSCFQAGLKLAFAFRDTWAGASIDEHLGHTFVSVRTMIPQVPQKNIKLIPYAFLRSALLNIAELLTHLWSVGNSLNTKVISFIKPVADWIPAYRVAGSGPGAAP